MVHAAVCLEKEVLIEGTPIDEVISFCNEVLKEMRLKIEKEESSRDGKTTIFASEGALVPLVLKTLLFPFSMSDYVKAAQRSGMHVVVSSSEDGIHVYSCGIALDEVTGKLAKYTKEEVVEEVTDMMEALSFEDRFINGLLKRFPKARQIR